MMVVTAPTGQIGRGVLARLLDGPEPVRVVVRDPARLADWVRERCDVVVGSHRDAQTVRRALDGADALLWNVPNDDETTDPENYFTDFSAAVAEILPSSDVTHVVTVLMLGRGFDGDPGLAVGSVAMDDLLAERVTSFRALTCPSFMENMRWHVKIFRTEGELRQPTPGFRKLPTCSVEDVADVACQLLRSRGGPGAPMFPCSAPRICPTGTWLRSCPTGWASRSSTSRCHPLPIVRTSRRSA